jgi:hypothetical protein
MKLYDIAMTCTIEVHGSCTGRVTHHVPLKLAAHALRRHLHVHAQYGLRQCVCRTSTSWLRQTHLLQHVCVQLEHCIANDNGCITSRRHVLGGAVGCQKPLQHSAQLESAALLTVLARAVGCVARCAACRTANTSGAESVHCAAQSWKQWLWHC